MTETELKQEKKKDFIRDLFQIFQEIKPKEAYTIDSHVDTLMKKHFKYSKSMFIYMACSYAKAHYMLYWSQHSDNQKLFNLATNNLKCIENDFDNMLKSYELTNLDKYTIKTINQNMPKIAQI